MTGKHVLVIEDDALNMKLVKTFLACSGLAVLEAIDAVSGLRLAREHKPDLILMDIRLPGMNGLTATRKIRSDKALKDIPVVALTSHALDGDEERARQAGCNGYIVKPLDTRSFLESLSEFFDTTTPSCGNQEEP